jgi:hypothetical protein
MQTVPAAPGSPPTSSMSAPNAVLPDDDVIEATVIFAQTCLGGL